jgi:hypothetical protein
MEAERALDDLVREVRTPDAVATAASVWRMFGHPDRAARIEAGARKK